MGFSGFGDTFQGTAAGLNGDTITGFGGNDLIDLTNVAFASASLGWSGTGTSGTFSVTDGSHAATVTLSAGSGFAKSAFSLVSDLHSGTEVRWPPKTGQAAKRESPLETAGWPEVRHGKYTEETHG